MLEDALVDSNAAKMRELVKIVLEDALEKKNINTIWRIIDRLEGTPIQRIMSDIPDYDPSQVQLRLNQLLSKKEAPEPTELIVYPDESIDASEEKAVYLDD
jgi:hypothetical protein